MKELGRREEFHNRLREEWRAEDERAEQQRRRHEATREKKTSRQEVVEEMKEKKTFNEANQVSKISSKRSVITV